MKSVILILLIFLTACEEPITEESLVDNGSDKINDSIPSEDISYDSEVALEKRFSWSVNKLPIKVTTSHEFGAKERQSIKEMASRWEDAANLELLQIGRVKKNIYFPSLKDYYSQDKDLGIYIVDKKVDGIPNTTLAVTQIIAQEVMRNSNSIHYEIQHADIVFNNFDYSFSIDNSKGTFDLESVMLHELGHFLGLIEHSESKESVMFPNIAHDSVHRELYWEDINQINSLYSDHRRNYKSSNDNLKQGNTVIITIELGVDGSHREKIMHLN
jgi:hypothetical protein